MKIENSTIGLASQHASSKQITVEANLHEDSSAGTLQQVDLVV
jgi:hypothetical protein